MEKRIKTGQNFQEISSDIVPISSVNHKAKVSEQIKYPIVSTVLSETETIKAIEMTKNILYKSIKECSELLTTEGFSTYIQVKIIQDSLKHL